MGPVQTMLAALTFGFVFTLPLLAVHVYARVHVEPPSELSDDCKDSSSRPGSRADGLILIRPA